jgi:O-antigen/teichoic acid export membrane protein
MKQGAPPVVSDSASTTAPVGGLPHKTGRRVLLNTGALTGASLWRIATSFVLQMLIARVLGPDGLGHYTIAMAYLNVSQVVAELGLPSLLTRDLARQPALRRAYFRVMLGILVVASFVTWLALVVLSFVLPYSPTTQASLWLVGASLPLYAVTAACETLFQADERMELVMGVEIFINTLILALSILVLWRGGGELGLIGVIVVTQLVSALLCLALLWRSRPMATPQVRIHVNIRHLLKQTTPFFGLSLTDVLLQRWDILLLSFIAGPTITGIYSAAYSLVRVLMKLEQSFWKALYPTFSRLQVQSSNHYRRLAHSSLRFSLLLILPVASVGAALAPELMHFIFGGDYAASALVFRVLVWVAPLYLVEMYAVTILMVEHHLRASIWIAVLNLVGITILLPALTPPFGAAGAALAVVAAGLIGTIFGLWLLARLQVPFRVRHFWRMVILALGVGLLAGISPLPWPLTAALVAGLYGALCWALGILSPSDWQTLRRTV